MTGCSFGYGYGYGYGEGLFYILGLKGWAYRLQGWFQGFRLLGWAYYT
jgi:hypothetical protein